MPRSPAEDPDELRKAVLAARDRVSPALPGIDPGDLLLILQSLLRPPGTGRVFFLRKAGDRHVF
jgi:hypothetical protein